MRELMKSTNKEDIHQFIESVRGIPALWDHNNEEYKSTERRKALWEELANLYSFSGTLMQF
jgi:hypothetical protein